LILQAQDKDNPMNSQLSKRMLLIIVSATDVLLSGIVLLIYFGFLPIDISSWGIPRWIIGVVGGIWFFLAIGLLVYQVTRTDVSE